MPIRSNIAVSTTSRETDKLRIRLLSAGAANPRAFPGGMVTVYPWDIMADDEWIIINERNPNAKMYDIIPKVADLNGAKLDELFIGDATTILLVARSLRHNSTLTLSPTCPHCKRQNMQVSVAIPGQLQKMAEKPDDWPGTDTVVLPISNDEVVIRPLRIRDENAIEELGKSGERKVPTLMAHLLAGVVSVGGGTPDNFDELCAWFTALKATDQAFLRDKVDELHPRLDNDIAFKCDFCEKPFTVSVDLTKSFFRRTGP